MTIQEIQTRKEYQTFDCNRNIEAMRGKYLHRIGLVKERF